MSCTPFRSSDAALVAEVLLLFAKGTDLLFEIALPLLDAVSDSTVEATYTRNAIPPPPQDSNAMPKITKTHSHVLDFFFAAG
jgi:hypothetical protein